jgi:TonB-linked SusC/RagA family outer membrane protein
MKRITFLIFAGCLLMSFSAVAQTTEYTHSITDISTFAGVSNKSKKMMSLEASLKALEKKYDATFIYKSALVEGKTVPKKVVNANDFQTAFAKLLKYAHLTYDRIGKRSFLLSAATEQLANDVVQETVSGTVTDAQTGDPLPGVNILVVGTSTGAATDSKGHYSVNVPSLQDTLRFSFIGYQTQTVAIDGRTSIDVTLKPTVFSGQQLVVVGFGKQKESDLTGSISSISSKDLNAGVNASISQSIQGKIAGVHVTRNSGRPGAGISVRVRGVSSINGGNRPLYVIDGLPMDNEATIKLSGSKNQSAGLGTINVRSNPLNSINPNDIQSIQILKGPSATAIYGSRGSNGVVLITTKKGTAGGVHMSYTGYVGVQSASSRLHNLSTKQYIRAINGISKAEGNGIVFSQSDINSIGSGTNWQNLVYHTTPVTNNSLSLSGGDKQTSYRASLNYFNNDGIVKKTGVTKYIANLGITSHVQKKLEVGINLNYSFDKKNVDADNIATNEREGPINTSLAFDPTAPVFKSDGSLNKTTSNLSINNPLSVIRGVDDKTQGKRTFGSVYFDYNITKALDAKLFFGYDGRSEVRNIYNSTLTITGGQKNGEANIKHLRRQMVNLRYTMTYDKQINNNNSIKVLGGIIYQRFKSKTFNTNISDFPTNAIKTNNLGLGDISDVFLGSNKEQHKLSSYLGRINYSFRNEFLFTTSIRADGSSRFGPNDKYGFFPSGAFAWKLNEENFMPDIFSKFKLRIAYGVTGNQLIGNYNFLPTYSPGSKYIINNSSVTTLAPSRVANPNLHWEETKEYDIGLNVGVFENRLIASLDYYNKHTVDLLINKPLPLSSGYALILKNSGKTKNRGFEVQINSTNIKKNNFLWSTSLNFTAQRNRVVSLGGQKSILVGGLEALPNTTIYKVGRPLASYYGYKIVGVFQQDDNISESAQPDAKPGYPIIQDTDGDGKITPTDKIILGNPYPHYIFGITNNFSYRNFNFNIFIQGQQGADLFNVNLEHAEFPFNFRNNRIAKPIVNRWTPNNTDTIWPSDVNPSAYGKAKASSLFVNNASYVRLKSVKISYTIPQHAISSAEVYVTGENLLTITSYGGVNPEANAVGNTSNAKLDYNAYPLVRTFLVGVSLKF